MKIDLQRIYFGAVLGGLGGLVGWALGSPARALPH